MARLDILQQFYVSRAWKEFRFTLIMQRGCRCLHCGKVFADTSKLIAHHKVELTADNINDISITMNPDLIEIACVDCHNKETNRFVAKSHNVYVVYGAPLSGKQTAVIQMMKRGDLIVDIDRIWTAITMCPAYDKPNNVKYNVFAVKNLLIDNIKTRYGQFNDAYLIGGYPDKYERERVAAELGATLIYCESTKDECIERLLNDTNKQTVRKEWERYINAWFDKYTE
ncbi:HNH endonuclease signature motif containing protein [Paludicola sp. MB14-C6]|uniref:HNH endonuclease signature motif containing protein n=1 Tax=Paludihabitans sp. MB14-C6 TaxID=3070656 RepID=UPI0027DCEA77|nr:HNH endonuclease signature motif containing protein [Paludicola sp. MB14-C6]WMJ23467.1 HNH endonuclease signature motif containing protein [Paludicola sp. MB14-C6]